MQDTISIAADRLYEAEKLLKKLDRRARRLGMPFRYTFGERRQASVENPAHAWWYPKDAHQPMMEVVDVTFHTEAPHAADWDFVARLTFASGGCFVDKVPGCDELPERFRHADQHCDHCHTDRRRKDVFVVRHIETGEYMQVGRNCLADFLRGADPKTIIERFQFLRHIKAQFGDEDGFWFGSSGGFREELSFVLGHVNAAIRIWGWVSRGQERAASEDAPLTSTVTRYLSHYGKDRYSREEWAEICNEVTKTDYEFAQQVITWVRSTTKNSDYFHNLRLAFHDDIITDSRRLGLVASAVAAYHREQEMELKRAAARRQDEGSRHIGEVGQRLRGIKARCVMVRGMGDNGYGWTELLKFKTEDGDLLTWFTGTEPRLPDNCEVVLDGTVKAHKEFKGIQETQLTRVRIVS